MLYDLTRDEWFMILQSRFNRLRNRVKYGTPAEIEAANKSFHSALDNAESAGAFERDAEISLASDTRDSWLPSEAVTDGSE